MWWSPDHVTPAILNVVFETWLGPAKMPHLLPVVLQSFGPVKMSVVFRFSHTDVSNFGKSVPDTNKSEFVAVCCVEL